MALLDSTIVPVNTAPRTTTAIDTTGAKLIVVTANSHGAATSSITDSEGNTWTAATSVDSGATVYLRHFYCIDPITDAAHTFTVNAGTHVGIVVQAFDDVVSFFGEDQNTSGNGSTTVSPGSIDPSPADSLFITGIWVNHISGNATIGSSFTLDEHDAASVLAGNLLAGAHKFSSTAENPAWSFTAADAFGAITSMLAFVPGPEITTTTLPNGSVGVAYSETLAVTGGVGSIAWSVTVGALPDGLSLNASTGEISGTPTSAGTFNFTVEAEDDNSATDTQALSIIIEALAAGVFPSFAYSGIRPTREMEMAPDWPGITDSYEFEDGRKDFNEVSDTAPIRWEYEVTVSEATALAAKNAAAIYHEFYNAHRHSQPFTFEDKFGTVWTDVRVEEYERRHDTHKSWTVYVRFLLVSFTGEQEE